MELKNQKIFKVAVLLSCYNGSQFLNEQVDSILKQKDVEVVLFIRDDGSTDEKTLKILEAYQNIENVKIKKETNVGLAESFMSLLYDAGQTFDFYCFSDQDDIWLENKIIKAIEKIKEKKCPTLYTSNQILVNQNLENLGYRHTIELKNDYKQILCNNLFSGCTMLWNNELQSILSQLNRRPSHELLRKRIHDVWVAMVAAVVGEIVYDSESYILYRQHESNVVGVRKESKYKEYLKKIKNPDLRNGRSLLAFEIYQKFQDIISNDEIKENLYTYGNYKNDKACKKKVLKDSALYKYTKESKFEFKMKIRMKLF